MATVAIQLGDDEASVIRWALSHEHACVKEPLEGRGLLLTWEPERRFNDSTLVATYLDAEYGTFQFVDFVYEWATGGESQAGNYRDEWKAIGLPLVTVHVPYTVADLANPDFRPLDEESYLHEDERHLVFVWRFWIERLSTGWVFHLPGVSSAKAAYEAKRLAKQWAQFDKAHRPQVIRDRLRLRISDGWAQYYEKFAKVQEAIAAGEYYLANLCLQFRAEVWREDNKTERYAAIDFAEAYVRLRRILPAKHGCYLELDENTAILSASPERLVKVDAEDAEPRMIETCPIKGTRPVRSDPIENQAEIDALVASPKENAELTMIVDLERNDLRRVCDTGTVIVDGGFRVESTPHVHHRVATVRGKVQRHASFEDILSAMFPGGSVTGAPKQAVINALAKIETKPRGPYCGSVVWIGADGSLDSNILIRTIHLEDFGEIYGTASFGAGGGITIDSDAHAEYVECFHKARGMAEALEPWVDISIIRAALERGEFPEEADWVTDPVVVEAQERRVGELEDLMNYDESDDEVDEGFQAALAELMTNLRKQYPNDTPDEIDAKARMAVTKLLEDLIPHDVAEGLRRFFGPDGDEDDKKP